MTHATIDIPAGRLRLREARLDEAAARPLLTGLAEDYASAYGAAVATAELATRDAGAFEPPEGALLLLEADGATVAGGGLVRLDAGVGEIKRMWTAPEQRRRGHARRVLAALEGVALARGYTTVRLQTGDRLSAALALYREAGYAEIPPFGPYEDEPRAVGFEKRLAAAPEAHRGYPPPP